MRRAFTTLATLTIAALCCGAMSIGAKPTIHDSVLLGFTNGPLRISGSGLRESTFPTGHSVVFTGTPNVTIDACSPMPCVSGGARILSWTSSDIRFDYLPATITGGFTAAVTTPRGTSAAVSVEMYALTQFSLPAPTDTNLTASTRLLVDGFEYGCSGGEPCSLAGSAFTHDQWSGTTGAGTITNDFASTPWNGDTGNNWAMHTSGGAAYRYKTIGSATKEISAHFEFCPQSLPAAARTVMAFRGGGTDQMFLTYGSDGILRSYYNTTGSVGPVSTALPVGTCYEIAALQDADTDTAGCARLSVYVDGTNAGDTSLCSLSITAADTFRLGAIDGTIDVAFDNVVLASGVDQSVIYLRLADLHPNGDGATNAWTRYAPIRSGCDTGANYECVNDATPNGMCSGVLGTACDDGATDCSGAGTCLYVDGAPLYSIDNDESGLVSTNAGSTDQAEFTLSDVTLGTDPLEKFAAGGAVAMTCWVEEQSTGNSADICMALSDGSTVRCGTATNINGYGATAYVPVTQLYTTD